MWELRVALSMELYVFSIAAVTTYHKLHGLKPHKFHVWRFCTLEVQHGSHGASIKMLAGVGSSLEVLRENCFLDFSSIERLPTFLDSWSLPCSISLPVSIITSLSLTLTLLKRTLVITLAPWDNPGKSSYFKVSWLATLIPPCHVI